MKRYKLLATAAAVFALGTAPLFAQGKSGNAPKGGAPKTTSTAPVTHGNSAGAKNPNAGGPKASAPARRRRAQARPRPEHHDRVGAQEQWQRAAGPPRRPAPRRPTTNASTTGSGTTTTTTPTTTTVTMTTTTPTPLPTTPNKVSTKVTGNPAQLAKVTAMLPDGMTLEQASAGFRNQGQFIAALNASKNRGLVFADLQKAMTVDGMSLGQAAKYVQTLPPAPAPVPAPTTGTTTPTTGTTTTDHGTDTDRSGRDDDHVNDHHHAAEVVARHR